MTGHQLTICPHFLSACCFDQASYTSLADRDWDLNDRRELARFWAIRCRWLDDCRKHIRIENIRHKRSQLELKNQHQTGEGIKFRLSIVLYVFPLFFLNKTGSSCWVISVNLISATHELTVMDPVPGGWRLWIFSNLIFWRRKEYQSPLSNVFFS